MINEELTDCEINLAVRVGSTAAAELRKALEKIIGQLEQARSNKPPETSKDPQQPKEPKTPKDPELKQGKQTMRQLHAHNEGLSSIELKDPNLRALYKEMKKHDIDFSVVKDGKGKCTLFFKGKNVEEMTNAFKRYTEKTVARAEKKAIKTELKEAQAAAKALDKGLGKEKNKSKGAQEL